jgi:uncharacterized protein
MQLVMQRIAVFLIFFSSLGCARQAAVEGQARAATDVQLPADRRCMAGQLSACDEAVEQYAKVTKISRHARERTVAVLYRSCLQGQARGCHQLAKGFEAGRFELPARKKLRRIYTRLCGSLYPRDPGGCFSSALFARACDLGMASGCRRYAALLRSGRVNRPHRQHLIDRLLRRSCGGNDAKGCFALGGRMATRHKLFKAATAFGRACQLGHGEACFRRGGLLRRGVGPQKDMLASARLAFERACQLGHSKGCLRNARMLATGRGTSLRRSESLRKALEQLQRACELGSGAGCFRGGMWLRKGRAGAPDILRAEAMLSKALKLNRRDCEQSRPEGCTRLAHQVRLGLGMFSYPAFKKACKLGSVMGCVALVRGDKLVLEDKRAQQRELQSWALKQLVSMCSSANQKHRRRACSFLATQPDDVLRGLSQQKQGVEKERLVQRACRAGHKDSCAAMAVAQERWNARTVRVFRTSCQLGSAAGCYHHGLVFEFGLAGRKGSAERAARLYRQSCRWGLSEGCRRVGLSLRVGAGAGASAEGALKFFERACRMKNGAACMNFAELLRSKNLGGDANKKAEQAEGKACDLGHLAGCVAPAKRALAAAKAEPAVAASLRKLKALCVAGEAEACALLREASKKGRDGMSAKQAAESQRAAKLGSVLVQQACKRALVLCSSSNAKRKEPPFGRQWQGSWPRRALVATAEGTCTLMPDALCQPVGEARAKMCMAERKECPEVASALRRLSQKGVQIDGEAMKVVEKRALKASEASCRRRDAKACLAVAVAYEEGRGAKKSALRSKLARAKACRIDKALCN